MKKLFIIAAAAATVMAACSSDEKTAGKEQTAGGEIGFRPVITKNATRATEINATNISDFKAYGLWNGSYEFMYGIDVVRGDGNAWSYSPLRYWPATGTVDFYAYSPAGSRGIVHSEMFDKTSSAAAVIAFDVPTANGLQEDFLIAAAPTQDKNTASGVVQLTFTHALSQLVFEVNNSVQDVNFEITDIAVTGLNTKGTLSLANLQKDGTWSSGGTFWTAHATPNIVDFRAPISIVSVPYEPDNTKYTSLSGPNDGLMVFPQAFANLGNGTDTDTNGIPDDYESDAETNYLVVTYGVKLSNGGAEIVAAGTKTFLQLGGVPNGGFEIGKKYIFRLDLTGSALNLEPISISVVGVTDWNTDLDDNGTGGDVVTL